MHLMMMVMVMMWAFVAMTAAQPRCDPLTEYTRYGECCKLCGPGTSMTSLGTCLEPQCQDCERNEYQDKYTKELNCLRQPYCDPNRNFLVPDHKSNKRSTCTCKHGFHCSTEECITCVPHTACKPGHGVRSKGTHMQDTVCQKCSEGTYSDETSWDGVCKKWTECGNGQYTQQSGTDVSDNTCAEGLRTHVVVVVVVLAVSAALVAVLMFWLCRGKQGDRKGKVKGCVELCLGEKREPLREARVLITTPTDPPEEESTLPEAQSSMEEGFPRTPEENEDEPSQEISATGVILTDKGNFVKQEMGKTEILSRQESQTQTFTD